MSRYLVKDKFTYERVPQTDYSYNPDYFPYSWIDGRVQSHNVMLPLYQAETLLALGVSWLTWLAILSLTFFLLFLLRNPAMAVVMVSGNVANMPSLFESVRFLTTAVASEMSYASGLQRQALFSIALVLFLFIMLINATLNFFLKRDREG